MAPIISSHILLTTDSKLTRFDTISTGIHHTMALTQLKQFLYCNSSFQVEFISLALSTFQLSKANLIRYFNSVAHLLSSFENEL